MGNNLDFNIDCKCNFLNLKDFFIQKGYFKHEVAAINLKSEYISLIGGHKKNFWRDIKKAEKLGYTIRQFDNPSYITEVVEINHSKQIRCGKEMGENYKKTVEDFGGQLKERKSPPLNSCPLHFTTYFGVFSSEPGYWGDGKLVGYIRATSYGNWVNYDTILGHGNHLKNGIMPFLHLFIVNYFKNIEKNYIIYYLWNCENKLQDWKRRAGFRPIKFKLI